MEIYENRSLKNLPSEEWKNVVGYEGLYLVSNYGRVKSLPKKAVVRLKNSSVRVTVEKILKQTSRTGYCKIGLIKDKKQKQCFVHRLVAIAFISNAENKLQINHKDCVRHNNNVLNLEWVTQTENYLHAVSMGKEIPKKIRTPKYYLEYHPLYCKKIYKYRLDGKLVAWYNSFGEAARRNNTKSNNLSRIVKSKTRHTHKGFYYLDFPLMNFSKEEKLNRICVGECTNPPQLACYQPNIKQCHPVQPSRAIDL